MTLQMQNFRDAPSDKPSAARMYDYFLGGFHNFEVDRRAAERVIEIYPEVSLVMRANRAFVRRAVTFLLAHGIDQFLDLGSGIPAIGSVHEVAQRANLAAHVVYVDSDPVVIEHSKAILHGNLHAAVVGGDVRQPAHILTHPTVTQLLDFDRPVGVIAVALLHFVPNDAQAYDLIRTLRDAIAPGSYLAIAHATTDAIPPDIAVQFERLYAGTTNPGKARSRTAIERFFTGLALIDPGIVYVPQWQPEGPDDLFLDHPERSINLAGIGYKPLADATIM